MCDWLVKERKEASQNHSTEVNITVDRFTSESVWIKMYSWKGAKAWYLTYSAETHNTVQISIGSSQLLHKKKF